MISYTLKEIIELQKKIRCFGKIIEIQIIVSLDPAVIK